MNYIIIEDEYHNAHLLKSLVEDIISDSNLLVILPTIQESIEWFKTQEKPDIIFMDIRLADGLSFDIFKEVDIDAPVIFTTAYDEYALQAFKVYGAAYLLKPIVREELKEAIFKFSKRENVLLEEDVKAMFQMLTTHQKSYKSRFLLHYRETYRSIAVDSIDYVYLENKITFFKLLDGHDIPVPFTLDEIENQLNPKDFFRVNRQYIIHINSIASIQKYFNEKAKIILRRDPEAEVIVSRIKMPNFKIWLDE